jgi:hypothetical protein
MNARSLGSALTGWLRGKLGNSGPASEQHPDHEAPWYWTLWLTGVDYFSSLGYAPSIAFLAAGYVAPVATLLLVAVTFLAAVPTYGFVAKHSPGGDGSIKMIERLTTGWGRLGWLGKTFVLILIGFAMTAFVITITLSAADASIHILENPYMAAKLEMGNVMLTALLIAALGVIFLKGFKEAVWVASIIGISYMALTAVIIARGLVEIAYQPDLIDASLGRILHFDASHLRSFVASLDPVHSFDPLNWLSGGGLGALIVVCVVVFPKLALGLSGFETGVSVMPHIKANDAAGRVRNTRKLLVTAASIMSVALIGTSIVTSVLIPPAEFGPAGNANGRALAFLAHDLFGGTVWAPVAWLYDVVTVLVLWFAGASAMAGLLNIIPRYLPRFGMSPQWIEYRRPLVLVITAVCLVVNVLFQASVDAQGAAYATGVLVLMGSAAFAVLLAEWQVPARRIAFLAILGVFLYLISVNVVERPEGLRIATLFVITTVVASIWSRWQRASEVRVQAFSFVDKESERLWTHLRDAPFVVIIPLRTCDPETRRHAVARSVLHLEVEKKTVPAFLHIELTEDPSNFASPIRVKAYESHGEYVIEVTNAIAVANAIAFISMELKADEVAIGLIDSGSPVVKSLMYLLLGTGEVGYAVRAIFQKIKEERLNEELRRRREFDRDRDSKEKELLRRLVDVPEDQRGPLLKQLFEDEAKKFESVITRDDKLPRLILIG